MVRRPRGAEVGGADGGVTADRGGRAGGGDAALDEDGDAVGEAEDGVGVVLDEEDRVVGLETGQEGGEGRALLGAEAGQRLVEEEDAGVGCQHGGEFQAAALAVAEARDGAAVEAVEAHERQRVARGGDEGGIAGGVAPDAEAAAAGCQGAGESVAQHVRVQEEARDLEAAA
jgi:hypothetical protein